MRARKKPWAESELQNNRNLTSSACHYRSKWHDFFGNNNPIHIEIGCGKGTFITQLATLNNNINYIGIEKETSIIITALKTAREQGSPKNLAFFIADIKDLREYFSPGEISRIYINFCDPWHRKKKWAKRRLTHRNFLDLYEELLYPSNEIQESNREIFLKTDNQILFEFSLNEFADQDWKMKNITLDLHKSSYEGNIMTEYETKFSSMGMPIYRLEATKQAKQKAGATQ